MRSAKITSGQHWLTINGIEYLRGTIETIERLTYVEGEKEAVKISGSSVNQSVILVEGTTIDGIEVASQDELVDFIKQYSFKNGGGAPATGVQWDDVENKPLKTLQTPIEDSEGLVPVYTQNGQLPVGIPQFPENAVPLVMLDARLAELGASVVSFEKTATGGIAEVLTEDTGNPSIQSVVLVPQNSIAIDQGIPVYTVQDGVISITTMSTEAGDVLRYSYVAGSGSGSGGGVSRQEFDELKEQIPHSEVVSWSTLAGTNAHQNGYYQYNTGVFVQNNNYRSKRTDIRNVDKSNIHISTVIVGGAVALAIYLDENDNYLGFEKRGENGVTTNYTREKINPPANAAYLIDVRYGNTNTYATVELRKVETVYEKVASEIFVEQSLIAPKPFFINEDYVESGDSITADMTVQGYTPILLSLMNPKSFYNNAVGSSCWSKKNGVGDFVGLKTQNFDDPNFAGISSGTNPTTDPVEMQKRLNNCSIVHIQKFISEFNAGQRVKPTMMLLAWGTNNDTDNGNTNGDIASAVAGASIDRDDTYSMTKAMRWVVQTLWTAFPGLKIYIASPIQSGATAKNNSLRLTKIPLMRDMSYALSVPFIDLFGSLGIYEKFEVPSGPGGRYLRDGLHENPAGATKHANYLYNRLIQYFEK